MAIKPVKPGGWGPNFVETPPEPSQIDQRLAAQGLALAGDTVTGTLSVVQDPLHPGTFPIITGSATITAAGAVMGTGPNGGKLICTGSVPVYSPATRTRRVRFSTLEVTRSVPDFSATVLTFGYPPVVDPSSGGITMAPTYATLGFGTFPNAGFDIPITKPHSGATFDSIIVYYFYRGSQSFTTSTGQLTFKKVNITTGAVTVIATSAAFPTGSPPVNAIQADATVTGLSEVVDLTSFVYRVGIQPPGHNASVQFVWTSVEVNYKTITDERFTQ